MIISWEHYDLVFEKLVGREWWEDCWPNFTPKELACKGSDRLVIDAVALNALQSLRTAIGKPLFITSAYRTWEHHAEIYKGYGQEPTKRSLHLTARAFDIACDAYLRGEIIWHARDHGFTRVGDGVSRRIVHLDNGTPEEGYATTYWTY